MMLIAISLAVFAITLTITKSKLFACKREYVEKRYQASKLNKDTPGWLKSLHKVWVAWWTCPMCLGFYVSAVICLFFSANGWFLDTLAVYGLNWLWHCLEDFLFQGARFVEFMSQDNVSSKQPNSELLNLLQSANNNLTASSKEIEEIDA